jgi:hypothetical protein
MVSPTGGKNVFSPDILAQAKQNGKKHLHFTGVKTIMFSYIFPAQLIAEERPLPKENKSYAK